MSATADTAAVRPAAGDDAQAPVLASEGRTHPVEMRWRPRQRTDRLERAAASAVEVALRDAAGDVLVFLPGIAEITRTADLLTASVPAGVDVRLLAGALPRRGAGSRPGPVATRSPSRRARHRHRRDVAHRRGRARVVDGGLARAPRHDTGTGMTRLVTVAISRDSAEQRAGRAGRTEPGVCYRLWSRIEHGTRPAHRTAEILDVDLGGLALELAAWGAPPGALRFADPPPTRACAPRSSCSRCSGRSSRG